MLAIAWRRRYGGIALVLSLCASALVYEAKHVGATTDEPSHFAAAYAYWLGQDNLDPPDTPPLTRLVCGWVPRVLGVPDPRQTPLWQSRDAYMIGSGILGREDIRGKRLRFYTRLPLLIFPLLTVFLAWYWSTQLFGPRIALIVAAGCALEPTLLGHGALINSDAPAAFGALWFAYAAWGYHSAPTTRTLFVLSVAVTCAVLTKFSLLPLFAIGYALAFWKGPRLRAAIGMPLVLYTGIAAASQFRVQPVPPAEVDHFPGAGVPAWAMPAAKQLAKLPWPPQFVRGMLFIGGSLQGKGFTGYMLGHKVEGRVPAYFPLAWAVKFPIPLQALVAAGLAAFVLRWRRRKTSPAEWIAWGTAGALAGLAVFSNFHIGFRHLAPVIPLTLVAGGFGLQQWGASRAGRIAIPVGLVWLAVSTLMVFPNGISYFNEWVGGSTNGWTYLADSNLDWGQNYPELGAYLRNNGIQTINTFISSFDNPWYYLKPGSLAPQTWPTPDNLLEPRYIPKPGVYAISANALTGLLMPPGREDYLEYFRRRRPDGRAGYSILIYRVS